MATGWIEEYENVGQLSGDALVQAPKGPPLRLQEITFSTTAAVSAELFDETGLIIFAVDANAYWRLGFKNDEFPIVPVISSPKVALKQGIAFAGIFRPLVIPRGGIGTDRFFLFKALA